MTSRHDPGHDLKAAAPRLGRGRAFSRRIRIGLVVAGLCVVFGALALVLPGLVLSESSARANLVAQMESLTGEEVSIEGDVTFSLLPRTRLTVDRIHIGETSNLSVDRIVADLDPADALFGRPTISRLVLIRPEYRSNPGPAKRNGVEPVREASAVDADRSGGRDARDLAGLLLARFRGLQVLEVRDGVLRPIDSRGGSGFSNANLTVSQPNDASPMSISGSFIWNGQPTEITASIDSPQALSNGAASQAAVDLSSPALTAGFDGRVSLDRNSAISGRLQLATPSLGRSLEWIGDPANRVPEIGSLSLSGALSLSPSQAALQDTEISIGGVSTGRGAMEADFTGPVPKIGGTLAFSDLDLLPFSRSIAPLPNDPFDYDRPIDIGFVNDIDLDIRLSAVRARLGDVTLANLAGVVDVSDGKAKFDLGDAAVFDGRGQAEIVLDGTGAVPQGTAQINLTGVRSQALMNALAIRGMALSGRSTISANIRTPLANWAAIVRDARVEARMSGRQGAISGFDPGVFANPGMRPLLAGTRNATMPFAQMDAEIKSDGRHLAVDGLTLTNDAGTMEARGTYSIGDQKILATGTFEDSPLRTATVDQSPTADPAQDSVFFTMVGTWPDPTVTTRSYRLKR